MAANGEDWIAMEVFHRELMTIKCMKQDKNPEMKPIVEWLENKCSQLSERCKG